MWIKGVCVNCSGCIEINSCVRRCEFWLGRKLVYAPGNDRKWLGVPRATHQSKTHCVKISLCPDAFRSAHRAYSWGSLGGWSKMCQCLGQGSGLDYSLSSHSSSCFDVRLPGHPATFYHYILCTIRVLVILFWNKDADCFVAIHCILSAVL